MELNLVSTLKYYRFETSRPGPYFNLCNDCYLFWKKEWSHVFNELNVTQKITSDDFSHKTLGGLFLNEKPIGFILYHELDSSLLFTQDLKYFNPYPQEVSELINSNKEKIFVISYMTLDSDWRKSRTDLPVSEILVGLSILNFMASNTNRLITFSRNDRKVNGIVERHGGRPLLRAATAYNVEVDFFQILKAEAKLSDDLPCKVETLKLWQKFLQGENNGILQRAQKGKFRNQFPRRKHAELSLDGQESI